MNAKTAMYIVKRLLISVITIIAVITITFFVMQAVPGNPFLTEKGMTAERLAALKRRYGLDRPLLVQWLEYIVKSFRFDFGVSLKDNDRPVMELIMEGFKVSAVNGLLAAFLAIVLGIIFGILAAVYRGRWVDKLIMFFSTAMVAVPSFIIAAFLLYNFCVKQKMFPVNFGLSNSPLKFVLPVISLALYPMSYIIRLTRTSTLDTLDADYVRTARAKGVSPFKVLFKHVLRNSLTPVITYAGPMIAFLLTGSLVVEKVFSVPGLGNTLIKAIQNSNYPMIMGATVFVSILVVTMILISDILYKIVNPKVDLE